MEGDRTMRAINDDEKAALAWLISGGDDIALAAIEFDGEETAAIVMVDRSADDDGYMLLPVAVLIPPDRWFDRMTPPTSEGGVPPTRVRRDDDGVYQPVDEAGEAAS
jgi:hypothetical protein